jgi:hypothetical protein
MQMRLCEGSEPTQRQVQIVQNKTWGNHNFPQSFTMTRYILCPLPMQRPVRQTSWNLSHSRHFLQKLGQRGNVDPPTPCNSTKR